MTIWAIRERTTGRILHSQDCRNIRVAVEGAICRGKSLRRADLRGADLEGANLSTGDLREADLRGANLMGADLRYADLTSAMLSEAELKDATVRLQDLAGVAPGSLNPNKVLKGTVPRGVITWRE